MWFSALADKYEKAMDLTYNISEKLDGYLKKIDQLRAEVLLAPLSPKAEHRLKWEANLERIYWSISITENTLTKSSVVNILSKQSLSPKNKLSTSQKEILAQRKALAYIKENWMVSKSPVTMSVIKKLYEISCRETLGPMSGLTEYSEKGISTFLDYLQRGHDHPVIQAGIGQVEIINITPFDNGNGKVGRLLSYLFLYKNGYDVREMISFEESYRRDLATYKRVLDLSKIKGNLTLWLEYFAYSVLFCLEKSAQTVKNQKFQVELPAPFWKLNNRQRQILEYLNQPGMKITNKEVQKTHKISQITASRDLAKLTNLGLLLSHGKGRSVYYTSV